MSHYKPYPAYKDSGVEWLVPVPHLSAQAACLRNGHAAIVCSNKTRQGSVRKHLLKPAGYLYLGAAK